MDIDITSQEFLQNSLEREHYQAFRMKKCIDKASSMKNCNTDATKLKARKNWITKRIMISYKNKDNLYCSIK